MMMAVKAGRSKRGSGFINTLINKLPVEVHLPGYQYCGPGTKLQRRLTRGDPGINPLDAACKEHDIAYSQKKNQEDITARNKADQQLADKALKRVFAKDASLGERAAALGVTNIMKIKSKFGMGMKKRGGGRKKGGKGLKRRGRGGVGGEIKKKKKGVKKPLRQIVDSAKFMINTSANPVKTALIAARKAVCKAGGKKNIRIPRVLPIPSKVGGFLPLIPLLAGLSATGALAGGAAGIAKAVNDAKAAKQQLEEAKRHNEKMEAIALGRGLYLKPWRKGMGLYLKPMKKKKTCKATTSTTN